MLSRPLDLTAEEVMLAADRVQNGDKDDGREVAKPLLLKLGSAYLEMLADTKKAGVTTIWITEPETWLLRSKFNSGDRVDGDAKLGIHMLRKLYTLLLAFDADIALPDAEESGPTFVEAKTQQDWLPPEFGWRKTL